MSPQSTTGLPEPTHMAEPRPPVLPLPRELRDLVYQHLLTETFTVKNSGTGQSASFLPLRQHPRLAILNVSRSTYQEARKVLCREGHFRFEAVKVGSPPLHEEIQSFKGLDMLQDITIHIEISVATSFVYWRGGLSECTTMLIKYFASLEPKIPRKRCVVEFNFATKIGRVLEMVERIPVFSDALSGLTGFKIVELKSEQLQMSGESMGFVIAFYHLVDERLAMTLGEAKRVYEGGLVVSLIYHPGKDKRG